MLFLFVLHLFVIVLRVTAIILHLFAICFCLLIELCEQERFISQTDIPSSSFVLSDAIFPSQYLSLMT